MYSHKIFKSPGPDPVHSLKKTLKSQTSKLNLNFNPNTSPGQGPISPGSSLSPVGLTGVEAPPPRVKSGAVPSTSVVQRPVVGTLPRRAPSGRSY